MEQEKKRSPYQMLWEWARAYHGSFYAAVIFAVLGVVCSKMCIRDRDFVDHIWFLCRHFCGLHCRFFSRDHQYISHCVPAL